MKQREVKAAIKAARDAGATVRKVRIGRDGDITIEMAGEADRVADELDAERAEIDRMLEKHG
jgi:hypothetical protein